MKNYIYDGTFEGLLCCIYAAYYDEYPASIVQFGSGDLQMNMLMSYTQIVTDESKARKVYEAIENKISNFDLRRIYKVFLSCDPEKEMKILRYVVLGFKYGRKVSNLHGNQTVFDVQLIDKKVGFEIHRMYGLVRFSELEGGIMYAKIEPDNDIISLMATHFSQRFRSQPFILHDKKRAKAIISDDGRWHITAFTEEDIPSSIEAEKDYQTMWKTYFEHIAIKERKNPRCQKNFMPVRYWKNLTEVSQEVPK